MSLTFEVRGFDELEKKLSSLGEKGEEISDKALDKGAQILLQEAQKRARKRTGLLRSEIKIQRRQTNKGKKYVQVGISTGSKAFYAKFLEFGTSKMSAKPFLRPALESKRQQIQNEIIQEIEKNIF